MLPTFILAGRVLLVLGLLLAAGPISPTAQVNAAPAAPTFTVNNLNDAIGSAPLTDGVCETAPGNKICTLRAAIMEANHYPGGGVTINLPAGMYALTLAPTGGDEEESGDLNITASMTINGAGAGSTIIDANQLDRVLYIRPSSVSLSHVTLRNGKSPDYGGGIFNAGGVLTLNYSTISHNISPGNGGGISNYQGTLTLNNSTINNNRAQHYGGGIAVDGTLTLNNSTISNNSVGTSGGGLDVYGTLNAYYSTIVGNLADDDADGSGGGGGIHIVSGSVNLKGTLLAQNYTATTANDCQGTLVSQDYNLIQTTAGCAIGGVTGHNITGVANPFVDPLRNNGGSTPTRALLVGSPAVNAIPAAQCVDQFAAPLTVDQRGSPRPAGGACDIGAYEGSLPLPLLNRNLVRNGDAEDMAGSPTGAVVSMPNWSLSTSGALVAYGADGGFPLATDPGPIDRGYGFFAGGTSALSTITQDIIAPVASLGAAIDAGKVRFMLTGYFGGYLADNDLAYLEVVFLNTSHGYISSPGIGLISASDRGNQTKLLFSGTIGLVPTGTRYMQVNLKMYRYAGSYNDGYADNLSLVLVETRIFLPLVLK